MRKPSIGTISEGTLKTEDLLQAFADELEAVSSEHADLLLEANYRIRSTSGLRSNSQTTSELVNDLQDAIAEVEAAINGGGVKGRISAVVDAALPSIRSHLDMAGAIINGVVVTMDQSEIDKILES